MPRFRKKPVEIEAVQFTGRAGSIALLGGAHPPPWFSQACAVGDVELIDHPTDGPCLRIETLEGAMRAKVGDWIIRGVRGEIYPCDPEIFDETYEAIDELADQVLASVDPIATLAMIGNEPPRPRDLSCCPDGDGGYS